MNCRQRLGVVGIVLRTTVMRCHKNNSIFADEHHAETQSRTHANQNDNKKNSRYRLM